MTKSMALRRRNLVASVSLLPFVPIRGAGAAGSLSVAFVSSLVPGWDGGIRRLVEAWGEKNKVGVRVDFLSGVTDQALIVPAAEAQARSGHDIIQFNDYDVAGYADKLEPVDDVVTFLVARHGPLVAETEFFAKLSGTWRAVPTGMGSNFWPAESRIDLLRKLAAFDVQAVFPVAPSMGPGYDRWTWDTFLLAAEKCFRAGVPFGLPISNCADANAWINALFLGFGAQLVGQGGDVTVRSDRVREALDYVKRLGQFLPSDAYIWNNASNNRALVSGKSALIFNPPSAWASAVKDNPPVGMQIWHHPLPTGQYSRGFQDSWGSGASATTNQRRRI